MPFDTAHGRWPVPTSQFRVILLGVMVMFVVGPFAVAGPDVLWALTGGHVSVERFSRLPTLIFGAALVLGFHWLLQHWRRRELRALAAELGGTFTLEDRHRLCERLKFLDVLEADREPQITNVVTAPMPSVDGKTVRMFDLTWKCPPGSVHQTHSPVEQGVLICEGEWQTPRVVITTDRTFERPGLEPLELELVAFNDAYRVLTDNRKFAFTLLHARAVEELMEHLALAPHATIDLHRGVLVVYRSDDSTLVQQGGELWHREDALRAIALARAVLRDLPPFLLDDHTGLECPYCGAVQSRPSANCEACGKELRTKTEAAAAAADRLSPLQMLLFVAVLVATPLFNFAIALGFSLRYRRQRMKRKETTLTVLFLIALVIQGVSLVLLAATP